MGPWQESLPEDGICKGLFWPSLSWWSHPPHPQPCPSSGFGLFRLVLLVARSRSDGPKAESCCPTTTTTQVELSPE